MRALAVIAALLASLPAAATIIEPNGLQVPRDSANGETQLYTLFQRRGESIDWKADAHAEPAVFSPLCGFSATYVLNQAGSHLGLAWYNVDPGATQPPTGAALHTLIPANSSVGASVTSGNIAADPNYQGGLIGFALIGGQTHYSEAKWNINCSACSTPGPWVTALMYKSTVTPDAYYLAFEDGNVSNKNDGFSNDGDFNDDVYLVTGVACSGAGAPCDTGQPGVCGAGLTECDNTGSLHCRQLQQPADGETCDGLDNDCNGMVDDGAECPTGTVCDRGRCVEPCGASEFACEFGYDCVDGLCIETACVGVECPPGQSCRGGQCRGACDGVVCPHGQVCRADRCVDPCAGVTCDDMHVCQGGICVIGCACQPCGADTTCSSASGLCVDSACVSVSCDEGNHCEAGACVGDCEGVACPEGEHCEAAACVANPPPPMDMDKPSHDAGPVVVDMGAGEMGREGGPKVHGLRSSGCSCQVGQVDGIGANGMAWAVALLLGAPWRLRRRRRARR